MSPDLLISLGLFATLFFGIAALSLHRAIPSSLWEHPSVYALSFLGVSGIIFFFGSIELVGRYGVAGLLGIFAYGGIFVLAPLFIEPLRWISHSHAFSSLPDLLAYRYRSPWATRASSITLALASLPIAAAQLSALGLTFSSSAPAEYWPVVSIALLALIFILLFSRPDRATKAITGVSACGALLGLSAVLACGYFAVFDVFGSFDALNHWAEDSSQDSVILRFEYGYALILLFFPLAFIMPQQGLLQTLSIWWPRHSPSSWRFPALLLLVTAPVFPILWAGLKLRLDAPLQQYVATLPLVLDIGWLRILTLVATLFIAVGLLAVIAMALGKILVTGLSMIPKEGLGEVDLDRWLHRHRLLASSAWLALAFVFAAVTPSHSVSQLSIVGMLGLIQLLPGIIGMLYIPKVNHQGFLCGLLVGLGLWFYGIVGPLFGGPTTTSLGGFQIGTGTENWPFWLLESLVANTLVALGVSLVTTMSEEEKHHAHASMVDNLPTPQRQSLELGTIALIESRLAGSIGRIAAQRELAAAQEKLHIDMEQQRPLALRMLRDRLSFQLSAKLGTLTSDRIIDQVIPISQSQDVDDISLLESQLASAGNALSGVAAELNKLRLYHRQTVENLPMGVFSFDTDGEILLWNQTMEVYTGIRSCDIEGGNLADLKAPWVDIFTLFRDDAAVSWPAHEIHHPERGPLWFHLSKFRVTHNSPFYSGHQIMVVEDITERLRLIQELAHAERLTAVGRLAAGVAHEIGNPITGISCLAQDLRSESNEPQTLESAAAILDLTERVSSIVYNLIDFSRSDHRGPLKPVCLSHTVDRTIQLLQLDKEAKVVEFRSTIPEDQEVLGDEHQLMQVFVNLLANARDASPINGVVEIHSENSDDRHCSVYVTDWGSGIPTDLLPRVMDPFFTTKDPGQGTGLGLSIVYSIMRFHRGTLKLISPWDGNTGTRVVLALERPTASSTT